MIAVRVMQVAVDEIVDVVAVRHRLVTATRPVDVTGFVAGALVRHAAVRVLCIDLDGVLVVVVAVGAVEMAVVQVTGVVAVTNGGVPALGAVGVWVIGVLLAAHVSAFQCRR
jgi:hypothetical protein